MADTKAAVKFGGAYKESDDHVPDPTALYDTYNTSGTGSHHVIENTSPVFDVAKREALIQAGRALDPDDDGVPESAVVLPQGSPMTVVDHDALKDQIRERAAKAKDEPVVVGGKTAAQEEAEKTGEEGTAAADAERVNQGTQSAGATGDKTNERSTAHRSTAASKDKDGDKA